MGNKYQCGKCGKEFESEQLMPANSLCPECSNAEDKDLAQGTDLNGYEIIRVIGKGGMGTVYLATQKSMQRKVALKVLHSNLTKNAESVQQFMKEVRNAGKLTHPNIVSAYDAGECSGLYYMVMQYIDGATVDSIIEKKGVFSQKRALEIIIQIASALEYIWKKYNLFHRDIKPGNFMLDEDGNAMLMDMGIAQGIAESGQTRDGMIECSPFYMSPEQVQAKELSWTTDLYSLGASLFQMVTGVPPFDGKSLEEIMMKRCEEPLPDPNTKNPDAHVTPEFFNLLKKMMAVDPPDRYLSWGAFIKAAQTVMSGKGELKTVSLKKAELKTSGLKTPGLKTPGLKTPGLKIPGLKAAVAEAPKAAAPVLKAAEAPKAAAPVLKAAEAPKAAAPVLKASQKPAEPVKPAEQKAPEQVPSDAETPPADEKKPEKGRKILKLILIIVLSLTGAAAIGAGGYFGFIRGRVALADKAVTEECGKLASAVKAYQGSPEDPAPVKAQITLLEKALENRHITVAEADKGKKAVTDAKTCLADFAAKISVADSKISGWKSKLARIRSTAESGGNDVSASQIRNSVEEAVAIAHEAESFKPVLKRQEEARLAIINDLTILQPKLSNALNTAAGREAAQKVSSDDKKAREERIRRQKEAELAEKRKIQQAEQALKKKEADAKKREAQKLANQKKAEAQKLANESKKRINRIKAVDNAILPTIIGFWVKDEFQKAAEYALPADILSMEPANGTEKKIFAAMKAKFDHYSGYAKNAYELRELMNSSNAIRGMTFKFYVKGKQIFREVESFKDGIVYFKDTRMPYVDMPQDYRRDLAWKCASAEKKSHLLPGYYLANGLFGAAYDAMTKGLSADKKKALVKKMEPIVLMYIKLGYNGAKKDNDLILQQRFENDYKGQPYWYKALGIKPPKPKAKPKPKPKAKPKAKQAPKPAAKKK